MNVKMKWSSGDSSGESSGDASARCLSLSVSLTLVVIVGDTAGPLLSLAEQKKSAFRTPITSFITRRDYHRHHYFNYHCGWQPDGNEENKGKTKTQPKTRQTIEFHRYSIL